MSEWSEAKSGAQSLVENKLKLPAELFGVCFLTFSFSGDEFLFSSTELRGEPLTLLAKLLPAEDMQIINGFRRRQLNEVRPTDISCGCISAPVCPRAADQ